jgi:hypothetical protein
MSLRNIGIVYRKEMVDSLRDRRTLVSMIIVPILLIPLMTIGLSVVSIRMVRQAQKETPRVMILGGEDSPRVVEALQKLPAFEFVPEQDDYVSRISNKQLRAAVQIPRGFDAAIAGGEPAQVAIFDYEGEIKSEIATRRLETFFQDFRQATIEERLAARNLPSNFVRPFEVEKKNVAPPEKVGAAVFGGLIPYLVILLCMTGAMYPAMDLTAGEKERGTMETILTSPVSRTHLARKVSYRVDGLHLHGGPLRPLDGPVVPLFTKFTQRRSPRSRGPGTFAAKSRRRACFVRHGFAHCRAFFRGVALDCAFCQELQRGAELHFAPDDRRDPARRRLDASGH